MILDTDKLVVPNWFDYDFFRDDDGFGDRVTPAIFRKYLRFVNSQDSDIQGDVVDRVRESFYDFLDREGA